MSLFALWLVASATPLSATDPFVPTRQEAQRIELMNRPETWFERNLKGPPVVIDGQHLDPKLQYYLEKEKERLTPDVAQQEAALFASAEGRSVIRDVLTREWAMFTRKTAPMQSVEARQIDSRGGKLDLRIYRPAHKADEKLPVIVYFHGGGWIYSNVEAVDRTARLIANEAKMIVVSVDYRLAPEHTWRASLDDGEDAYRWTRANAECLGGDPTRIAVGGDSAGGTIALSVSRRAALKAEPMPLYQLLYYPGPDFSEQYRSMKLFEQGFSLDAGFIDLMDALAFDGVIRRGANREDAEMRPMASQSLADMPATIIATAGFDMLRDSGRAFASRLEQEGVAVTYLNYPSLIHGFLQWSGPVADADRAATDTARLLGTAIRSRANQD